MTFGAAGHSGHAPSDDKFLQPHQPKTNQRPRHPQKWKNILPPGSAERPEFPADSGRLAAGRRVVRETRDTFTGDNSFRSFERVTMPFLSLSNFDFFVNHRFNGFRMQMSVKWSRNWICFQFNLQLNFNKFFKEFYRWVRCDRHQRALGSRCRDRVMARCCWLPGWTQLAGPERPERPTLWLLGRYPVRPFPPYSSSWPALNIEI